MENAALLFFLETILGKGNRTSRGNYSFVCPFHVSNPPGKKKLEINSVTTEKNENPWHCWGCEAKGKTIKSLVKQMKIPASRLSELNMIITPTEGGERNNKHNGTLSLPKEYIPLINIDDLNRLSMLEAKHALNYLKKRGITNEDIIKYNIGFCNKGPYENRIIIPSYDKRGNLNYFIARAYTENIQKYKNPPIDSKSAIGWELYINWDAPIILVEGIFDALTIKRNVIPLFGKIIHEKLMKKLVSSSVNRIYIALDPDAIKSSLKYAEKLMSYGKEIFLVTLDGKDASEVGFKKFLNIIEQSQPLNFQSLLKQKLEL